MEFYKQFLIFLNFFASLNAKIFITDFFDFRELDKRCVAFHLQKIYNFPNTQIDENLMADCVREINDFERSITEFVVKEIEGIPKGQGINNEKVSECAINLLEFYNVTALIFKASAYAHKIKNVSVNPQKSCENVVKFAPLITAEGTALAVKPNNETSFTRLRHCLNDLFQTYRVEKIVFIDEHGSEFIERKFGKHLVEFLKQMSAMSVQYCENEAETLKVEKVEDLAQIDLFGFTELSLRVENCIIDEIQMKVGNNSEISIERKIVTETILKCMKEF
jgi:hypothetical protein